MIIDTLVARQQTRVSSPLATLTPRELDVLRLLRSDLGGPDIARELRVSPNTMRTHTKNIFEKLGVHTRTAAVARLRAGDAGTSS